MKILKSTKNRSLSVKIRITLTIINDLEQIILITSLEFVACIGVHNDHIDQIEWESGKLSWGDFAIDSFTLSFLMYIEIRLEKYFKGCS